MRARLAVGVSAAGACVVALFLAAQPAAHFSERLSAHPSERLSGQVSAAPPIDDLVASLQQRYAAVRTLTADFEHRVSGGVLSTTDVELGTVLVKRPGRWRFDYLEPEPKSFVSDGATVYAHFPLDRQVMVTPVPADAGASNPAAFLAGRGNLVRDFAAAYGDARDAPPGTWVVQLTPLGDNADYEMLELAVDRRTLDIRRLATTDFLGAVSTYRFDNLRTNRDLPDALFTFEIPPNTEVLTDEGPNHP